MSEGCEVCQDVEKVGSVQVLSFSLLLPLSMQESAWKKRKKKPVKMFKHDCYLFTLLC